jgi:hypothetical protein
MLQAADRAGGGPAVLVDMAGLLLDQGRADDATPLLQRAAQAGRGPALDFEVARWESAHGRHEQAATLYRALMKHDPKQLAPRLGYARCQVALNRPAEAETAYTSLLQRDPKNLQALSEFAALQARQNRFAQAVALYDRMEAAGSDVVHELSQIALAQMFLCIWDGREALLDRLAARVRNPKPCIMDTTALLAGRDDPELHRQMGERMAGALQAVSARRERPAPRPVGPADRKLRIGYLCGSFTQHTIGMQLAGVLEAHDRDRFELTAYDYSPEDSSLVRARIKAAFQTWVDISAIGPVTAAQRIVADEIDVLVDLNGYTQGTRTEIIVLRPAPIQVNFLGYPATQAGEWTDYVIADTTVLPDTEYANWTEQPVLMPSSCIPNDRTRPAPGAGNRPFRARVAGGSRGVRRLHQSIPDQPGNLHRLDGHPARRAGQRAVAVRSQHRHGRQSARPRRKATASIPTAWYSRPPSHWNSTSRATPAPICSWIPFHRAPTPPSRTRCGPGCPQSPTRGAPGPAAPAPACCAPRSCPIWSRTRWKLTRRWPSRSQAIPTCAHRYARTFSRHATPRRSSMPNSSLGDWRALTRRWRNGLVRVSLLNQ